MSKNIEVLLRAKEATELFWAKSLPQKSSEVKRAAMPIDPIGRSEEAELVQRVFLLPAFDVPRVVVFCGVGQADGAGGICARAGQNLASQTGSTVCVVEGDFQSPSLHKYLGVENSRGLTDALLESGPIRDFVQCLPGSDVSVLPGGSRSGELQAPWKSERLRSRIAELRREFSYVLVYSPQMSQHAGGILLGQIADGVILILESMVTRRETARTAKENLAAANVKILGAVLNNHTFSIPETLYRRL
jgi:succinoglycan biosynthesis transport protein ExoP